MCDNRRDYDQAAEDGPVRGTFANEDEDPNGVEERFDKADNASVERTRASGNSLNKKNVGNSYLEDPEERNGTDIEPRDLRERCNSGRQCQQCQQKITVDHGYDRIHTDGPWVLEQHYLKAKKYA